MKSAAVVAVALAFAFVVAIWIAKPYVVGDTGFVLDGSNAFLTCLSNHDYSACGYTGKLNDAGRGARFGRPAKLAMGAPPAQPRTAGGAATVTESRCSSRRSRTTPLR